MQMTVVFYKAELAELVHEEVYPGARGPHPCRQNFLADSWNDHLEPSFLPEVSKEQENPCQPLLAGIEQLVDEIGLELHIAREQERREHLRQFRFLMKQTNHRVLFDSD